MFEDKQAMSKEKTVSEEKAFLEDLKSDSATIALLSYIIAFIGKKTESDIVLWIAVVVLVGAYILMFYNLPKILKVVANDKKRKAKVILRHIISAILYLLIFGYCFHYLGFINYN